MDIVVIFLRIIHIFSGVLWIGWGAFAGLLLIPTIGKMGAEGGKFMQNFLRLSPFATLMIVVSLATTISGILLFFPVRDQYDSTQTMVLNIGMLFGLLAFGHGAGATGPATKKMTELAEELHSQGKPPSDEQMTTLMTLQAKLKTHGNISLALTTIALLGMVSFRYF